jgi:hypothetical protein
VERWKAGDHPAGRGSSQRLLVVRSLFLWSLFLRVFARFCALSFPLSSNPIGRESAGNKSRKQLARTRENPRMFSWVDPRPSASSALIRGSSYVFQASPGASAGNNLERGFSGSPRILADKTTDLNENSNSVTHAFHRSTLKFHPQVPPSSSTLYAARIGRDARIPRSIKPPPSTRSPSYITSDWPGVIAATGSSSAISISPPSARTISASAGAARWRI